MTFLADLHIHSRFSRATARNCDLPHLAAWAQRKGIAVLGSGDFTHPAWRAEIGEQLEPAEEGLFRLAGPLASEVQRLVPRACAAPVRFMLSVEIATIYKKGEKTRKVHHVVFAPSLAAADRLTSRLERIGNLHSDGRPILGLDSRDLLEMVLDADPACFLVPAHVWTPWFAVLGSKSGFDRIEDCYGDLSDHIFALETGLSSDPAMNWRVSALDRYRLVSNSDAHSPAKLGREATAFSCPLGYHHLRDALRDGRGYGGTVEFFPEEGKYHLDGHRKCGLRLTPAETLASGGRCPACGGPITVGVVHRVSELADRGEDEALAAPPATAGPVRSLVPLPEILGEILAVGPGSKRVGRVYESLLAKLGAELPLLWDLPLEEVRRTGSGLLAEAIGRLRRGQVKRQAGYDGEYGLIRLFEEGELDRGSKAAFLFAPPDPVPASAGADPAPPGLDLADVEGAEIAAPAGDPGSLDDEQDQAVRHAGSLVVIAGPGSGKTRVLVERVVRLIGDGVPAAGILAVTFTNRAAGELSARIAARLPAGAARPQVATVHALGHQILRQVQDGLRVADEQEQQAILREASGLGPRRAAALGQRLSASKRGGPQLARTEELAAAARYATALTERGLVDFDDLVARPLALIEAQDPRASEMLGRFQHVLIDEFQDLDPVQWRLLWRLSAAADSLCAIGDPDQSIYGFRGADPELLKRLPEAQGAALIRLGHNYRSVEAVVAGAAQVIRAGDGIARRARALLKSKGRIGLHLAASDKAEAEFVVHSLERLIGGHSFFSLDSGRSVDGRIVDLSFSDFAVLYRTEAQAEALIEALGRSGMPFQCRSHKRLVDLPAVAALRESLIRNPGRGDLGRRLRLRCRKLIDPQVAGLAAPDLERARQMLDPLVTRAGDDLERFLSDLALSCQADTWEPRAERVSLLTLHAAKGLEFRVVFLLGCEDGLLPLRFGGKLAADPEEERRLFFVGMTRAREQLILCRAVRRRIQGKVRELPPSPFLAPIEAALTEEIRLAGPGRKRAARQQLDFFGRDGGA